jgi:Ca-activated chloride channel homolog
VAFAFNFVQNSERMIGFLHTEWLWGLLGILGFVPAAWAFLLWRKRQRKKLGVYGKREDQMPGYSPYRVILRWTLVGVAWAGIILGIARPRYGEATQPGTRKGVYISLVLDVSVSMLAEDLKPNRLQRAKMAIQSMLKRLKNDQISLVVFAGTAHVVVPMTPDIGFVNMMLRSIDTDLPSVQGTHIGEALRRALEGIPEDRKGDAAVILITDGEDHEVEAVEVARKLAENKIYLHTLGIGSTEGTPIPIYKNAQLTGYKKDGAGNTVMTRLNEDMLRELARVGNGIYVHGANPGEALDQIFNQIDTMASESFTLADRDDMEERYAWFVWPAFFLLLIELLLTEKSIPWWKKWQFLE